MDLLPKDGFVLSAKFILVPYQEGKQNYKNGQGPGLLLAALREQAIFPHAKPAEVVELPRGYNTAEEERQILVDLAKLSGIKARDAREMGQLPIFLIGNCYHFLGLIAHSSDEQSGVIWLDAHGDYNTWETSPSGYLDGMGLAIAAGKTEKEIPTALQYTPVSSDRILLAGVRELDSGEEPNLKRDRVQVLSTRQLENKAYGEPLTDFRSRLSQVLLHIDLDVLDPQEAPGVNLPVPGGVKIASLLNFIASICAGFHLIGVSLAGYNPDLDRAGRTLYSSLRILKTINDHLVKES